MKDITEIREAAKRALAMWDKAQEDGTKYRGMSYEEGIRAVFDWILEDAEEDPTTDE